MSLGIRRHRNQSYNIQVNASGTKSEIWEVQDAAEKPKLTRTKIWILFNVRLKHTEPWVRAVLLIMTWIFGGVIVAFVVVPLALKWKSGQAWENFLQTFVTSPAAAGTAAVLAAVIAAYTFNKGLKHSKAEARDKAWWEKFEWVTDRIVPKDPKQERLASGLAFSLLESLEAASDADFQRKAIEGIKQTYIQGQQTDLSKATLGELRAQFREVQTFADSSWHSGRVSHDVRSYAHRLAISVALRETWATGKIELEPKFPHEPRIGRPNTITASIEHRGESVIVIARYMTSHSLAGLARNAFQRIKPLMELNDIGSLIIVINTEIPEDRALMGTPSAVRVVHWEHEHGPEALRDRIELALREVVPINRIDRDRHEDKNDELPTA